MTVSSPVLRRQTDAELVDSIDSLGKGREEIEVDGLLLWRYSGHVANKEATEFGDSDKEADNRQLAVFFRPYIAVSSRGSSGGDTLGYAGSFLPVRQPCHLLPTRLATGGGVTAQEGGSHA